MKESQVVEEWGRHDSEITLARVRPASHVLRRGPQANSCLDSQRSELGSE